MELRGKTVAVHTLGCKVNIYESEVMTGLLAKAGAVIVPFDGPADLYVINTCTVTNMADRKSRQMIHRAKKMNPEAVIVACGCYVQVNEAGILSDTGADLLLGNDEKNRIVEILEGYEEGAPERFVSDIAHAPVITPMCLRALSEHTRADVKVQDGCNQFCTYCIIPYARGRIRSKPIPDAVEETEKLAESGIREIVLTGIHLSSYGRDFEKKKTLLELIEAIHAVPGVDRIRLGSLEPRIVTEEFAKRLSELPKLCPHFHLSLQSGSAATLKRMNRHYTPDEYRESVAFLRKYFDHPAITTDVIAGFPGETEEEFAESYAFVREMGFYELHVFQYSRRHGTVADRMEDQVPEDVKKERSGKLIALGKTMSEDYIRVRTGMPCEVLTEEPVLIGKKTYYTGYTKEYIRVLAENCAGNEIISGKLSKKGSFVTVQPLENT